MPRSTVTATLTAPGMHAWSGASQHRYYLSYPHRHLFHITATVETSHDDRDIEYHDLRDWIVHWLDEFPTLTNDLRNFGGKSCETLARDLWDYLQTSKNVHTLRAVSVSEDGEFTSTLEATT